MLTGEYLVHLYIKYTVLQRVESWADYSTGMTNLSLSLLFWSLWRLTLQGRDILADCNTKRTPYHRFYQIYQMAPSWTFQVVACKSSQFSRKRYSRRLPFQVDINHDSDSKSLYHETWKRRAASLWVISRTTNYEFEKFRFRNTDIKVCSKANSLDPLQSPSNWSSLS